jgi:hypothetical protein
VQRCKKNEINGIDSATAKQMRQLIFKHLILLTFLQKPLWISSESREIRRLWLCDSEQ